MLVYLVLGLSSVVALLLVYRYDLYDREPWYMLLGAAGIGALAMWGLGFLEDFTIGHFDIPVRPAGLAIVAATHEEFARLILVAAIAIVFRRHFNDPLDGLIYGSVIGLGMAVSESGSHLARSGFDGSTLPPAEIVRVAGHGVFGGIIGFPVGMLRFRMRGSILALLGCVIAAIGVHFAWDWVSLTVAEGPRGRLQLVAIALMLSGMYLYGCLTVLGTQYSKKVFEPASAPERLRDTTQSGQMTRWPTTLLQKRGATGRVLLPLVGVVASASAVGTVTAFASDLHWTLELTAHFRVQYLCALFVAAATYASTQRLRWSGLSAGLALVNAVILTPLYLDSGPTGDGPRLRALHLNVSSRNTEHASVLTLIDEVKPELFVVAEVTTEWMRVFEQLEASYPHRISETRDDNFGIALFSKLPLEDARIIRLGNLRLPSISARVIVGDQRLTLLSTHPPPPIGGEIAAHRNAQLDALATAARDAEAPVLLLGDLNVTPWSSHFTRLLATSGLRDSSLGWGVQPTWPAGAYPLLIPIDHCLHSEDIGIARRETGPNVGSDHYPLFVDVVLRR